MIGQKKAAHPYIKVDAGTTSIIFQPTETVFYWYDYPIIEYEKSSTYAVSGHFPTNEPKKSYLVN